MLPTLYLIDGHALAYRTYYALAAAGGERFQTRTGEPTAGVYGFASVLLRILEQDRPEYLAVAFDVGKTFRDKLFPEYKATRAKMPDDLRSQIERIRILVDAFKFPRLEAEGFEADDVLGSIARQSVKVGLGVKIITGDRDLLQLVDDRVIVSLAGSKLSEAKDYSASDVEAYLGVRPDQVVDYKALVGDTSDNIPGVPGVGEKTAVSLLHTYPTLDEVYAHLDEIPTRVRAKLESGRESAYLSQDLARIRTDVQITLDLDMARSDDIDFPRVEALFKELEFRSLLTRLNTLKARMSNTSQVGGQLPLFAQVEVNRVGEPPASDTQTHIVDSPESLQALVAELQTATEIAVDTETTSTDPLRADLVGISLSIREGEGYYLPVGHHTNEKQLPRQMILDALRPALTDPQKNKIGHNLKYDYLVLAECGLEMKPLAFDTMIAEFLIDPSTRSLGLKPMAERYCGVAMTHIEELIGKGKTQTTMDWVPISKAAPYAAADADMTLRLKKVLEPKLNEHHATALFSDLEMPLVAVLAEIERTGIALDLPFFKNMAKELNQRLGEIEQQVYQAVGYPFNLNSTQQLSKVLFDTLGLEQIGRAHV
jgi:DNA polymerase-1